MSTPSPRAARYLADTLGEHYELVLALSDKMADAGGAVGVLGYHDADEYAAVSAEFLNKAPVPVNDATNARRATIEALWAKAEGVPTLSGLLGGTPGGSPTQGLEALSEMFAGAAGGSTLADLFGGGTDPAAAKRREDELATAAKNSQSRSFAAFVLAMPSDLAPSALVEDLYTLAGMTR